MAKKKNTSVFFIQSWNTKKQDWVQEAKEYTLAKAKSWAKTQSNVYTKTFRVIKETFICSFKDGKIE